MKTFTKTITLIIIVISAYTINAQKGEIKGKITDNKGKIVEFATVTLLKSKDSTLVKGALADENGNFEIEKIIDGSYILGISQVGFSKYFTPIFNINEATPSINFKEIKINEATKNLNEVQVKALKPFIEQQIDRTVINVENSIVSAGNTAMEVLEKSPGISVDQEGKISLKGKQNVLVYIDDKPTYMSQADLANMLKNTQASQIEKIEIMTIPPAKYDAAGNAGIINIKMKRNQNMGLNGSVNAGYGTGLDSKLPKINGGLNLNYRKGKINFFGNAIAGGRKSNRVQKIDRKFYRNKDVISSFNQISLNQQENKNQSYKFGIDYFANKKTTFGLLFNSQNGSWAQPNGTNTAQILNSTGSLDSISITKNYNKVNWENYSTNLNIKHTFDSTGTEISSDFDIAYFINGSNQKYRTKKYLGNNIADAKVIRNENGLTDSGINISSIKIDFIKPFNNKSKIELGAKSSYVISNNDMKFWFLDNTENNPALDPFRSRDFQYNENINAAYFNFSKEYKPISVQLGLRAENTIGQGTLLGNKLFQRNYSNLFPTAYFRKNLNKKNSLSLSFARRIDRPSYEDLNPFLFFLDPYTFQRGNEKLRPEFTNSIEMTHTFNDAITTTFNYSITKDKMSEIMEQNNELKTTNITPYNISEAKNIGLSISAPTPIKKWWTGNIYFNIYQNHFQGEIPRNTLNQQGEVLSTVHQTLDAKAITYTYNIQQQFILPKDFSIELSGWYQSPFLESQLKGKPMGAVNFGLRKKIMKSKGTISLNINDIFWTQKFRGEFKFNDINVQVNNKNDSRIARITFTYRFGNSKVQAARQRETGLETEKGRIKSNGN